MSWLESRTVFSIRFLSITGFTGCKTHAEKFCRLRSLLSPSEGWGILKYSCFRPAGCPQALPWEAAPGVEEGVNSASRAGTPARCPAQLCPAAHSNSCRGNAAPREQPTGIIYSEAGELGSAECGIAGARSEGCGV